MSEPAHIPFDRQRLEFVPQQLLEALREAASNEDLEELMDLADGVAEHDAEAAQYLRDLIETFAYDTLSDLFDVRGR